MHGDITRQAGFTLLQVAVVLMIISLIIGGTLTGRVLIRQGQINSAVADEQSYAQAAVQFQGKYGFLPGDFPNATTYWGTMSTCPAAPGQASQGGTLTCGGNGDGQIPWGTNEEFTFWQHMANAQMIRGQYTGIAGTLGGGAHVIGVNCPAVRIDGTGLGIQYTGITHGVTGWFNGSFGHTFFLGLYHSGSPGSIPDYPSFTTSEALALDTKYDDGLPGTGNIVVYTPAWSANCATSAASTAQYKVSATGLQCSMIFVTGF
jgi:type II secretory pathway pseudopilin PulG